MTDGKQVSVLPEKNEHALTALDQANALEIVTVADYTAADQLCARLKLLDKEVDEAYDEHISAAFKAHRSLVAKKNKYAEPIDQARKIIKAKMVVWQEAEEEKRRAEERRLQEIARKKAEEEALQAAQDAQQAGDTASAEAILSAPVEAPAVVLPKAAPKIMTSIRTIWKARIVKPNLIPREYLTPDEMKINGVARATKGTVKIPGVEFYQQKV